MFPLVDFGIFVSGLVLLLLGSSRVVDAGMEVSARVGLRGVAAGAVLFSFITAIPETLITLFAALKGSSEIAFGNIVGSNIHNIPLCIGIPALMVHLLYERSTSKISAIMIGSILLSSFLIVDGYMSPMDGILLLLSYVFYVVYIVRNERKSDHPELRTVKMSAKDAIFGLISSTTMLIVGSYFAVSGAINMLGWLGISEIYMGLNVLALGSVLPEFAVSLAAALQKKTHICITNVLGDNIFTMLVVLGLTGVIKPFAIPQNEFLLSVVPMGIVTLSVLIITSKRERRVTKGEGVVLMMIYIVTIVVQTIYLSNLF